MKKGGEIVALLWYVIKLLVLILTCSASDCLYFPSWFAPVCVQSLWQIRGQFWWSLVNLCVSFRYFRSVVVHNVARVQISDLQNCNSCNLKASERERVFEFSFFCLPSTLFIVVQLWVEQCARGSMLEHLDVLPPTWSQKVQICVKTLRFETAAI